jgi:hypothetical protein
VKLVEAAEPMVSALGAGPAPDVSPGLSEPLDLQLIRLGRVLRAYRTEADSADTRQLLSLLLDAVRRVGGEDADAGDYELVVRYAGERGVITTVVAPPQAARSRSRPGSAA